REKDLLVLKVHSHPPNAERFSEDDDLSDLGVLGGVASLIGNDLPHYSAVMLPDGKMFGRAITSEGRFYPLDTIAVAGDNITLWNNDVPHLSREGNLRHRQFFGNGTT